MSNSLRLHGQSMEFSRPEYWSGLYFPSPGDPPNPGIEPRSPALQEDSLAAESQAKPKNTGVGSLSVLQRTCPTHKSNRVSSGRDYYTLLHHLTVIPGEANIYRQLLKLCFHNTLKCCLFSEYLSDPPSELLCFLPPVQI